MRFRFGIDTIISGGQTGVDRAALDFAVAAGMRTGGFVPAGRIAEDGPIPVAYENLVETESADPDVRTQMNVRNSDATLIISRGALKGGSELTLRTAEIDGKPFLHVDLEAQSFPEAAVKVRRWLAGLDCRRLNVAGPRSSEDDGIYAAAHALLEEVFK